MSALVRHAPAYTVLVAALVLATQDGGFAASAWYLAALALLGVAAVALLVAPPRREAFDRSFVAALTAFTVFTAWSYASIAWADDAASAWDGANRTLLYLLAFALVGLRMWSERAARAALALVGGGLAALAIGVLAWSVLGDAPSLFLEGRLAEPTGYANATAALWLVGLFPLLHLATVRDLADPLRGLALGGAALLLQCAVLSQSRGAALALAVTVVVHLALAARRWPALGTLVVTGGLAAVTWGTLTEVRASRAAGDIAPTLADARLAIGLAVLAAVAVGWLAAAVGRRAWHGAGASPGLRRAGDLALAAGALAAIVGGVAALALSGGWVDDRWRDFKETGYEEVEAGETRFTGSLGSGRYDYWRVALDEFADRPVTGIGADNFLIPYLQDRKTSEAPRYPHSIVFRTLTQLGVVGALALGAFLAFAAAGAWRARRRSRLDPGLPGAALAGAGVWLVHGSVDWLFEVPALSLVAMALLALAMRTGAPSPAPSRPVLDASSEGPPRAAVALAGLVMLAAAISLALPGAAARVTRSAVAVQAADPAEAVRRLGRAADLNPLSTEPLLVQAVLARRIGARRAARRALQTAIEREPRGWFAWFNLGVLEGAERRRAPALAALAEAERLNPRLALVGRVRAVVLRGEALNPDAVERALYAPLADKLRPTE